MKTLSRTATTRPTAFSALTAAVQPELRWSRRRTRTPSSRRRSNRPLQSPCWISVLTPAIRQLDPALAKPPLRARYARGCDSHSISTPEARGTAVEAVRYRLAAIAGLLRAAGQNGGWRRCRRVPVGAKLSVPTPTSPRELSDEPPATCPPADGCTQHAVVARTNGASI